MLPGFTNKFLKNKDDEEREILSRFQRIHNMWGNHNLFPNTPVEIDLSDRFSSQVFIEMDLQPSWRIKSHLGHATVDVGP